METRSVTFTYQDYLSLHDGKRHEILEGDLVMVPAPSWRHQETSKRLFLILHHFVESKSLGVVQYAPVDVILSDENVAQPDILFIARDRIAIIKENGVFGPPDLVVEIMSRWKPERDEVIKKRIYDKYGVREYWIVDLEKKAVEVLALGNAGLETHRVFPSNTMLRSPLMQGLEFNTKDLFG